MAESLRELIDREVASETLNAFDEDNVKHIINSDGNLLTDSWRSFDLQDAYKAREPIQYVAGHLFEKPSLNIIYGAPGTLKSFLLADLLLCVAGGMDWLQPAPWQSGGHGYSTKHTPTMWLDFDNGQRRTLDRFKALGQGHGCLPMDTKASFYSMPNPWLVSTDSASVGMLALRIKAASAEFVCIDNLGAVLGDAEENSGDMAKVMSNYRQVAEETGAAITLIHHQRKGNGINGRMGDSLRGHSSIEAALDLALLVEREPYAEAISITATKTRGDDVLPFRAQFTYEHNTSGELETARFWGLGVDDNLSDAAITREVKCALTGTALDQKGLVNAVKEALPDVGVNRIRDNIARNTQDRIINVEKGKNNSKVYSV